MFDQIYYNQLVGTIVAGVVCVLVVSAAVVFFVMRYKLKIEQIKADALVKAEEIRAKNTLEIEKLMINENYSKRNVSLDNDNLSVDNRVIREKANL